ncbi:MAG: hypothetical protein AAGK32_04465, partial [Actinomycetota bacterium]
MGPIQIFLFGFEDFEASGPIAEELAALSDAGTIRIVDARLLLREGPVDVVALGVSDLDTVERADLRAALGALAGIGAGAGPALGVDAALGVGELGLTEPEIDALTEDLAVGDALL